MSAANLQMVNVTKRFGGQVVLDEVSLDVPAGSIHAVIGPNGAGKSTLFGVIAGEHSPERGTVRLHDRDITGTSPNRRVRLGIARAFQVANIFPDLTVGENVTSAVLAHQRTARNFWAATPLRRARARALDSLEQMKLEKLADHRALDLSQGDRKRLEIAMTLELQPSILLLDEPTAGMSPEETSSTVALIKDLWTRTGLTVLLTEHDMNVVFGLAQQLTVLNAGRVLATGEPDQVRRRDDVRQIYLGSDDAAS